MAAHEHVHRLAATDRPENYPTRDALIAAQRARCPVCAGHDHTDIRPFGFDPDGQPIPAWWFTCPGTNCDRNTDAAQAFTQHLRAIAQQAGPHGLAYITKWQAERAADEIEQLSARPIYRCVEGCAIQSAGGDSRAGITFCGRHGWWPTWRPRSTT